MLNYDKHKEEIDKIFKEGKSLCEVNQTFIKAHCLGCNSDKEKYANCKIKTLEWLCQEHIEPVLSDEAKAYLKTILEPIEGCYEICKVSCFAVNVHELIFYNGSEYASLKYKTGTKLYKYFEGLDYDRSYSLEELGL